MASVPETVMYRGKPWYLHSVVLNKAKSAQIVAKIKKEPRKNAQVAKLAPALGETGARYAVYWAWRK